MAEVFLALGTNLGDRHANLIAALNALGDYVEIMSKSRLYETSPMYVADQPAFLNMVVRAVTELTPHELLAALKHLEKKLGRKTTYSNGPRLIDLDILYFDDILLDDEDLQIPHLRISERSFVLSPMADISIDFLDPRTGESIANMLKALGDVNEVKISSIL